MGTYRIPLNLCGGNLALKHDIELLKGPNGFDGGLVDEGLDIHEGGLGPYQSGLVAAEVEEANDEEDDVN
ncbi:hypothetical protein EYB26_007689 [Talaromyces marneffei]|uniref:uncharacterized protein n=1 Tax=Talaromyces marneffei TaxID=37727 RepID=UPI0012A81064|nr:uncharacterized protein EYB26_007689 [Talaromyces marneffei]QGA19989.1 hypothetical protein EYB26_007689 [Talaromyces marneffei]